MDNRENEILNQPNTNSSDLNGMNGQPVMGGVNSEMMNQQSKNNKIVTYVIVGITAILVVLFVYFKIMKTKTLSCTLNQTSSGMTMSSDYNLVYKGNKLQKMDMTMEMDLGDYSYYKDELLEQFESEFGDQIDEINAEGGKASISSTDDSILIEISASRSGVSTMLSVDEDEDYSYEAMKEQIEDLGYTCK